MSTPKQVLIIEDNRICQDIYKQLFRRLNCPIAIASTAAEGFALAKAFHYDCIISDWNLPDCDNHSLLEAIRGTQMNGLTPIYVISSHSLEDIAKACQSLVIQGVYSKPINAEVLEGLVFPCLWE